MTIDAQRFLDVLAPGERVTFQTFGDSDSRKALIQILHGTLSEHADKLAELNARGAGVFWMANAGDLKGRKASNVLRVRAAFVDLDGSLLQPVQSAPLAPHCTVETSPRRWHAYWRIADCPLADFAPLQKALAARFNGDAKVCDLPRVMRLPGFDHRKRAPFRTRIVELCDAAPYTLADFRAAFGFNAAPVQAAKPRTLPRRIPQGERNDTLFGAACGLVKKGFNPAAVNTRLQRINAERCEPPLCASEVDTIATNACAYGSDDFSMLSHKLLDSPELNALPLPSRWIIVTALRRYNGSNGRNIALTHADCRTIPGCVDEKAFTRYRRLAVESGILILAERGRITRDGKTPHLYAICTRFLRSQTGQSTRLAHAGQFTPSYIDKQSLPLSRSLVTGARQNSEKAA